MTGNYLITNRTTRLIISLVVLLLYQLVGMFSDANATEINKFPKQIRIIVKKFVPGENMQGEIEGIPSSLCNRYKVVVYVRTDKWYIYPYAEGGNGFSFSVVDSSCSWRIITVERYPVPKEVAVLLVDKNQNQPGQVFSLEQLNYYTLVVQNWNEIAASETGAYSETLQGSIGSSMQWGSGWLNLAKHVNLQKGDKVRVIVGGDAEKVIVRFLQAGNDPSAPVGIKGGIITVPKSRMIELILQTDYNNVFQISVHGGPNPWGLYHLGDGNRSASLLQAELIRK